MTLTEGTNRLGRDALKSVSSGLGIVASLEVKTLRRCGGDAEVDFAALMVFTGELRFEGCNLDSSRVGGLSNSATAKHTHKKRMISLVKFSNFVHNATAIIFYRRHLHHRC